MGHALWGGVEDSDAGFLRGEGELPECKPGGDVVKNRLDVAQLGLPPGGRAARDRRVDSRVIGKLGVGASAGMEIVRSLTWIVKRRGLRTAPWGTPLGMGRKGLRCPLYLQDMDRPVR